MGSQRVTCDLVTDSTTTTTKTTTNNNKQQYVLCLLFSGYFTDFLLSLLISNFIMMCLAMVFFVFIMFGVFWTSWIVYLSGECIISSVLSHHNKNLKWCTLKPSVHHSSWTVLQLHVTAQFYLENKGKYILEAWGHANPKDMKRRDRERAHAHMCMEKTTRPSGSSFCVFFFSPPGPALCKLG